MGCVNFSVASISKPSPYSWPKALGSKQTEGLRGKLDRFINDTRTEIAVAILILLSVVFIIVEAGMGRTDSSFYHKIVIFNDVLTMVFVLELSIRYFAETRKTRFLRRYWIDILSVMPLMRGFRILRVLRLLRLFRVGLILGKHIRFFSTNFRFIKLEYVLITLAIVVAILMGALSIRATEGGGFGTIEDALWFSAMTLIAGEPIGGEPTTALGKMITLTLMMSGLTVFAIFAGTVSAVMVETLRNLKFRAMDIDEISNHLVICGWNQAAEMIVDELLHSPDIKEMVVVSENRDVEEHPLIADHPDVYYVHGDFTRMHILKEAGIERASVAILLADDSRDDRSAQDRDARSVLAALLIEKMNDNIFTSVQLLNRDNETSLRQAGVEEIIVTDEYVGNIMASVVRNRGIVSMFDELLTAKWGHQFYKIDCPEYLVDLSVEDALGKLKRDHDATLIAVAGDESGAEMNVNPPKDLVLKASHRIVIAASKPIA